MTDTSSMTALMSAAARAAHPLVDDAPHLIVDTVARSLCEAIGTSPLDYQLARPGAPVLAAARLSACVRSAYAEHRFRRSLLRDHVVLGAGLDTSAHRIDDPETRSWLVDLPGVLAWRADLFERAGIADAGIRVPLDVASGRLATGLLVAGLPRRPAFVAWLGVTMYLEPAAVRGVLADLAALPPGTRLVFDHVLPPEGRDEAGESYVGAVAAAAGSAGEPWRCAPSPSELSDWLTDAGWDVVEQTDEARAAGPGFWPRSDALRPMGLIRLVHARRRDT